MKKALLSVLTSIFSITFLIAQTDSTTLIKIGDKAPLFISKTIDSKTIDIARLRGKIILINFFATWCGPCNQELPLLQRNIWDKYKSNPAFELLILGREHSEEEVADFVKSKNFTMPFAPDPKRDIFKLYATQSIPRNIIIGKDGNIIFQSTGYSDSEFKRMEDFLADALK